MFSILPERKKIYIFVLIPVFMLFSFPLFAGEVPDDSDIVITYEEEDEESEEIIINYEDDESSFEPLLSEDSDKGGNLSLEGLFEYNGIFSSDSDQDADDAEKKSELRASLKVKQGTELFHLFCRSNLYLYTPLNGKENYHYSRESGIYRDFRYASENAELIFNELYINFGTRKLRLRAGNQIFGWGTGDAFNPTSYFNPTDTRELFFKDDDELRQGVTALSGMYFGDGYTIETVFVPLHSPGRLSTGSDFWSLNLDNYTIPIILDEPEKLDAKPSNTGFGTRISATKGSCDFSLSFYHGPDKDPVYQAEKTILADNSNISILVKPVYGIMTQTGFDLTYSIDRFVFQAEASYSHNKTGVEKQKYRGVSNLNFPYSLCKTDFFSAVAGFNYFIPLEKILEDHDGETVLTAEYFHADYLSESISSPLLSDIFLIRLQDSFFKSHLNISFTAIFDLADNGRLFWPKIEYDFLNGFKTEIAFAGISGRAEKANETESLFYYLRNNDFISLKVRYEF